MSKILAEFNIVLERKREIDKRKHMTIQERAVIKDEKDYRIFQENIKKTIKRVNKA